MTSISNPPFRRINRTSERLDIEIKFSAFVFLSGCPQVRELGTVCECSIVKLKQRKGTRAIKTGALRDTLLLEKRS